MTGELFPDLGQGAPTRRALARYARVVSAVPRALAEPHPKWWHISLKVRENGAATDVIPLAGGSVQLLLNIRSHSVDVLSGASLAKSLKLRPAPTATQLADQLLAALSELGFEPTLDSETYGDDSPNEYVPEHARSFLGAVQLVDHVLKTHKRDLPGETGPVQLWPHNFDLAFEWYSQVEVEYGDAEAPKSAPAQVNFGFSPGDESHTSPYFYSNPWPFDDSFAELQLPPGARWFTESWQGTLLPYDVIAAERTGPAYRLQAYFRAVFDLASPRVGKRPETK